MRKKQRGRGFERPVTNMLTLAQCPRASPSPQREHSPVLFTQHDQRPSAAASDISFGVSDNELDDILSLAASDAEELLGSVTDPALLPSSASRNARLRADEELIRIMTKAVNELGLEWSLPEEPSRSRLEEWFLLGCNQAFRQRSSPSSPKYRTSSQNRGAAPTRLASVLLLQLLSHPLMALKKKYTSTYLLWMSLWPHISDHPQLSDGRQG